MLEPRLLTLQEAARYISHSPKWLYSRTGKRSKEDLPFKALKIGRRLYFDRRVLDTWVDSLLKGEAEQEKMIEDSGKWQMTQNARQTL